MGSAAAEAAEAVEFAFDPKRNPRTILLCLDENTACGTLVKLMRGRHFLSVRTLDPADFGPLPSMAADMEPDLVVMHLDSPDDLDRILSIMADVKAEYEEARFSFVVDDMADGMDDDKLAANLAARLNALVVDGTLMAYTFDSNSDQNELVHLVLPLYKDSITGDNALYILGAVADVMGVPGVAQAVDVFCNGREVKDILAAGDTSVGDKAAIISDIAGILGIDGVSNLAGFIDNANALKETVQSDEKNASARADIADAAKGMIESLLG